jgi:hypothetical protein
LSSIKSSIGRVFGDDANRGNVKASWLALRHLEWSIGTNGRRVLLPGGIGRTGFDLLVISGLA